MLKLCGWVVLLSAMPAFAADVPPQAVPAGGAGPSPSTGPAQQIADGRDEAENARRGSGEPANTHVRLWQPGSDGERPTGRVTSATMLPGTDPKTPLAPSPALSGAVERRSYMAWTGSLELAAKMAAKTNEAFGVYFCSEKMGPLVGEGDEAWSAYRREHGGTAPQPTLFDRPAAVQAVQEANIHLLVKIVNTPENRAAFAQYEASEGAIVIVGPDGKALAKFSEQTTEKVFGDYLRKEFERQMAEIRTAAAKAPSEKK